MEVLQDKGIVKVQQHDREWVWPYRLVIRRNSNCFPHPDHCGRFSQRKCYRPRWESIYDGTVSRSHRRMP